MNRSTLPPVANPVLLAGAGQPHCLGIAASPFAGRIGAMVDGGACPGGVPSTGLDLTVSPCAFSAKGRFRRSI